MNSSSLEFLKVLVKTSSPSGYEAGLAELYRSHILPYGDDVWTDVMGNVTAVVNPDASRAKRERARDGPAPGY